MGFKYSQRSIGRIEECHENLQLIAYELIHHMDVTVLCGHRGKAEQDLAYSRGYSKLKYPKSKHNKIPSLAIDLAPYPINWNDIPRFNAMCDLVQKIANTLKIKIRLGRTFSFRDYPHVELI